MTSDRPSPPTYAVMLVRAHRRFLASRVTQPSGVGEPSPSSGPVPKSVSNGAAKLHPVTAAGWQ